MKHLFWGIACAGLLAGCANIATVNGVPVNQHVTLSTQGQPALCEENPALCIVGGVILIGALNSIVGQDTPAAPDPSVPEPR